MKYKNQNVKIIGPIKVGEQQLKNKQGTWCQIEMLDGEEKGMRRPVCKEELK